MLIYACVYISVSVCVTVYWVYKCVCEFIGCIYICVCVNCVLGMHVYIAYDCAHKHMYDRKKTYLALLRNWPKIHLLN